jgi:mRNA interferase RelE/StbE
LAWTVEIAESAAKAIGKLDKDTQRRIQQFLRESIAGGEGPRRTGSPLRGRLVGLWRYRLGDYRLIALIEDNRQRVLLLKVGHRREVYR